jgi:hypothetical protein
MSLISKLSPTSSSIQKEYVEKRKRMLFANDDAKTAAVRKVVEALQAQHKVTADWHDTYLRIHRAMQAAELTINIDAGSWFSQENTYATYAQMYERAVGPDGKMVLTDADPLNPAASRAMTDDLITLPDDWADSPRFSQRRRLYKALNVTGATSSSLKKVDSDPTKTPKLAGDKTTGFSTTNKHFKPKAKQVFAALNYGRRPHGSTTTYGFSYLVLNPRLKENALYYPADTFILGGVGTRAQATFNTIGALLQFAGRTLQRDLWSSCHDHHRLGDPDPSDLNLLVEAHLFKQIKLAEDIQDLVLSRTQKSGRTPWSDQDWTTIIANATKWCRRNSVRLIFASS